MYKALLALAFHLIGLTLIAQETSSNSDEPEIKLIYRSIRAGINLDRMIPSGYYVEKMQFDKPTQPYFSATLDFDNEYFKSFIFRIEVGYKPMHFYAAGQIHSERHDEYELKARIWASSISLLYRIPWRWKIRPYGGIGVGYEASKIKCNTLTITNGNPYYNTVVEEDKYELEDGHEFVAYTAGLMLGKRYDFSFRFLRSRWSRIDDINNAFSNRPIILTFAYRL